MHTEPQMTASNRSQPHIGAESKIISGTSSCRSQGLSGSFGRWGGWGSNPGPADYESAALTG